MKLVQPTLQSGLNLGEICHIPLPLCRGLNWHSSWGLWGRIYACLSGFWQFVPALLLTFIPKCAHCAHVCAQISSFIGSTLRWLRFTLLILNSFCADPNSSGRGLHQVNSTPNIYPNHQSQAAVRTCPWGLGCRVPRVSRAVAVHTHGCCQEVPSTEIPANRGKAWNWISNSSFLLPVATESW